MHLPRPDLPRFAALAAFVLYAGTLGSGVTVVSLALTAQVAGWEHAPMAGQPLLWLLMLPLHLLPAAWAWLAVKLFAAAIAALIVGVLARTVQLLPWDHPWDPAGNLAAALPVLLAGAVCGLEFNFWQEATSTFGENLDLLLLAAALWLLFEYNVRRDSRWLNAATVAWGLGAAENWVMLVALPLFVAAVIRLERRRFFRWKLILRLAGLGLAGFSIYALLPLVNGLAPGSPWTLDAAWLASLRQTKSAFAVLYFQFWQANRFVSLGVLVYFLVPTLPLLVRMRDEGTRNKPGVDQFQMWVYRSLRAGLLLACLWLAFDPAQGPRQLIQGNMGARLPLLTFDYLNALGAGFLLGNLLLISQAPARDGRRRSRNKFSWQRLAVPVTAGGLSLLAIGLAARNAPAVCRLNFHPLERYGVSALNSLPAGSGVILGDAPEKLDVFEAALSHRHNAAAWLAVNTRELPTVAYRARLERRLPAGWLTGQNRHLLTLIEVRQLLEQVARTHRLFYLNPSFGAFFETFYLEPTGMIYEMKPRGNDPLDLPAMSTNAIVANEQIWTRLWDDELAPLARPSVHPGWLEKKMARCGLTPAPHFQDGLLAVWYSMSLNGWAVALQKQDRWPAAQARFQQALQLNTNNFSARISLDCNTNVQAGVKLRLANLAGLAGQLEKPDRISRLVDNNGPCDEPTVDYLFGLMFLDHGLPVQGAEQLERVVALAPGELGPKLALANAYNELHLTERSRPLIDFLRQEAKKAPANSTLDLNLALQDSYAWLLQTNVANARSALQSVVAGHPDDPQITARVLAVYLAIGDFTNALRLVGARLAKTPDDLPSLNNQAIILMQAGRYAEAVPVLDHVLTLTNLPRARINRDFARIALQDFTLAEGDLHPLENDPEVSGLADYGLAAIADHGHDTNSAVRYLRLCLTNTPAGSPLWQKAGDRLQMLEPPHSATTHLNP
jgi:tetratricopeptide (TPR) repeat protein